MPSNDEWQSSWSKLRDRFEDWSLDNLKSCLCTRAIQGISHTSPSIGELLGLCRPWRDDLGNEQVHILALDAFGCSSSHIVGLPNNHLMEWWIYYPELAELARNGGTATALAKKRADTSNATKQFEALADHAAMLISQRPKGIPMRYPWREKGAYDSRLWVALLIEFAKDFIHSSLKIGGSLPIDSITGFDFCTPCGSLFIEPDPGAASMIVLDQVRTGEWMEKLGVIKQYDSIDPPDDTGIGKRTKPKKKGRPSDTDHAEDRRVYEAWNTGQHKNFTALSNYLGVGWTKKKVTLAIDRHRKRLERSKVTVNSPDK